MYSPHVFMILLIPFMFLCRFSGTICCSSSPRKGSSCYWPCTKWVRITHSIFL